MSDLPQSPPDGPAGTGKEAPAAPAPAGQASLFGDEVLARRARPGGPSALASKVVENVTGRWAAEDLVAVGARAPTGVDLGDRALEGSAVVASRGGVVTDVVLESEVRARVEAVVDDARYARGEPRPKSAGDVSVEVVAYARASEVRRRVVAGARRFQLLGGKLLRSGWCVTFAKGARVVPMNALDPHACPTGAFLVDAGAITVEGGQAGRVLASAAIVVRDVRDEQRAPFNDDVRVRKIWVDQLRNALLRAGGFAEDPVDE